MTGTLYVLPESMRFDFLTTVEGEQATLKGMLRAFVFGQIHGQGTDGYPPVAPRDPSDTVGHRNQDP